jgi:molybdopterin-guanine dinucleotide biosynthesis protein A
MHNQTKIAGVILAGGRARRMNNQDKGLMNFKGRPMISYALAALVPVVDQVFINANRNLELYQQFGHPVISDQTDNFDGPLAGVLAAMNYAEAERLVVMPCDSPLIKVEHVQKMIITLEESHADVAVAFDGTRLHPVFLAINTRLKNSLENYLAAGQRKVISWVLQQNFIQVSFDNDQEMFNNINTPDELLALEGESTVLMVLAN